MKSRGTTTMTWQLRRGRPYYYRSLRTGDTAKKVYFGSGSAAKEQARLDDEKRRLRDADRAALIDEQARVAVADQFTEELRELASLLAEATLLAAGRRYH